MMSRVRSSSVELASFILFLVFAVGCSSNPVIENVLLSYTTVRSIVGTQIPMGVRKASPNGRTLTSNYFDPKNFDVDGAEKKERAFAEVVILGSSRPFKLRFRVFRERKENGSSEYESLGQDHDLAELLAERFDRALADRREDRNVIDDFRAF